MGRKLLLADDSVTIQKVVDLTFADEGMEVAAFGDGESALAALDEIRPDIILADVFMPGRNGYQVCESVKQNAAFKHVPVILLVGSFEPFDEEKARAVGADDYLTKPFQSIRQLVSKVNHLLGQDSVADADETLDQYHSQLSGNEAQMPATAAAEKHDDLTTDAGLMPEAAPSFDADYLRRLQKPMPLPDLDDETIEVTSLSTSAAPPSEQALTDTDLVDTLRINAAETVTEAHEATSPEPADDETSFDLLAGSEPVAAPERAQPETGAQENQPTQNFSAENSLTTADEALLDLGEIEPPRLAAHDATESVLDIDDELANMLPEPEKIEAAPADEQAEFEPETEVITEPTEAAPEESATAADTPPTVTDEESPRISSEPFEWGTSPPAAFAASAPTGTGSVAESSAQYGGTINAAQLAPEAIDAIARRVIELMSNDIVREIAWEVVPDLADLHVRRRLEEERSRS